MMNTNKFLAFLIIMCAANAVSAQISDPDLKLWYNKPATVWEEALPLGNAKTGAMVFGGITRERYQLNDNTLWSGYPVPGNAENGPQILEAVRRQLFNKNWDSASVLWKKMHGPYSARYLPLADLWIQQHLTDSVPQMYYRDLDLNNAVATVRYKINGVTYQRQSFISHPDKIMVVRVTSDKPNAIHFTTSLTSKLKFVTNSSGKDKLVLKGKAPVFVANRDYEPVQIEYDSTGKEGMDFEVQVRIVTEGGSVESSGNHLQVQNATAVTLYLSEATSFNGFNRSPGLSGKNPSIDANTILQKASVKPFALLMKNHIADYRKLFHRVHLNLGKKDSVVRLPTDMRLMRFIANQDDQQLVSLYYQFGRYLMIAASRPGSRPTNLQGIWNDHVQPPWGSNYTTNINTEMNYWPAENTNLSECHQPLFDFIKELAVNGAVTAKTNYGIPEGWVAHHNSDLWAKTSPTGGKGGWDARGMPRWTAWPMAGAWFSTHLWEHYLFTGDKKFLKEEAYPLMKGAAQAMLHWLIEDPETDYLVTSPSTSPENTVKIGGREHQLSIASTMDMSIIRELFTALIKTTETLGTDLDFRQQLIKAKERLYPYHIGKHGQLQEWFKDWDDPKDKHRHLSHLFGLHPGSQITVRQTPELAAAAKQSLIHRGDMSTGWSMAWKINWWARLKDGDHAYRILSAAFTYIHPKEVRETMGGGGTYPNLFDAHPPFQIDGNFGASAGITEMLLQSHEGELEFLPALPSVWKDGHIRGVKARGNFTTDIEWKNGRFARATILSGSGGVCRIRTANPVKVLEVKAAVVKGANPNPLLTAHDISPYNKVSGSVLVDIPKPATHVLEFKTEKGKKYTIVAQ